MNSKLLYSRVATVACLMFGVILPISIIGRQEDLILKKEISIQVKNVSLTHILQTIAIENKIPIGIEEAISFQPVNTDDINSKMSLNIQQKEVGAVLNDLFTAESAYSWQVDDGVIIVKPKDPNRSITSIMLTRFQVSQATEDEARQAVVNLPELQVKLKNIGISTGPVMITKLGPPTSLTITLDVKNVSLFNTLNRLAKITYFWHIFYLDGKMYIVI